MWLALTELDIVDKDFVNYKEYFDDLNTEKYKSFEPQNRLVGKLFREKFVFNKLYLKFFLNFLMFSSNIFFDEIKIIGFLKLFDLLLKVFRINSKNIL